MRESRSIRKWFPLTDYKPDDPIVSGLHFLSRSAVHLVAAKIGRQGEDPAVHQAELHLQDSLPENKGTGSVFTLAPLRLVSRAQSWVRVAVPCGSAPGPK